MYRSNPSHGTPHGLQKPAPAIRRQLTSKTDGRIPLRPASRAIVATRRRALATGVAQKRMTDTGVSGCSGIRDSGDGPSSRGSPRGAAPAPR